MIQVRKMLFETNSSSTHSLVMCNNSDFEDFKNGKKCLDLYKKVFINPTVDIVKHGVKLNDNGKPEFDGKEYKDFYDLCCDWKLTSGQDWAEGRVVMYWMLYAGGYYTADIEQFNGVTALSIEYNSEI